MSLILTGLVIFQLLVSNHLATAGERLTQMDQKIEALEKENESLKKEIALSSSLAMIAKKAKEMGFVKMEKFLYLGDEPFAFKNSP